jgi:RimJ/RimL family protein N-acetyltransferase
MMFRFPSSPIEAARLTLVPLRVEDAESMASVLADERLYEFTGGRPESVADLTRRYRKQVSGSGRPEEIWLNWIVRLRDPAIPSGTPIGTVQATIHRAAEWRASIAWVIGTRWQARGFASEAARALLGWLCAEGIAVIEANIHPRHRASQVVAQRAGFSGTDEIIGGEGVWRLFCRRGGQGR